MSPRSQILSVHDIVLVHDGRWSTLYLRVRDAPTATMVFESRREARNFLRGLNRAEFTERDLVRRTEKVVKM